MTLTAPPTDPATEAAADARHAHRQTLSARVEVIPTGGAVFIVGSIVCHCGHTITPEAHTPDDYASAVAAVVSGLCAMDEHRDAAVAAAVMQVGLRVAHDAIAQLLTAADGRPVGLIGATRLRAALDALPLDRKADAP